MGLLFCNSRGAFIWENTYYGFYKCEGGDDGRVGGLRYGVCVCVCVIIVCVRVILVIS